MTPDEKRTVKCDPNDCYAIDVLNQTSIRHEQSINKLVEGLQQVVVCTVRMSENIKGIHRMENRLDKVDERLDNNEEKDLEYRKKVERWHGALAVISTVLVAAIPLIVIYL